MTSRREPLCGTIALGQQQQQQQQQQQPQRLPLAVPVSPKDSRVVCSAVRLLDGARWLLPVNVEQPAVGEERDHDEGVAPVVGPADQGGGVGSAEPQGAGEVDAGGELPWEEARRGKKARDPGAPSVFDWDAHQATHLPCRIWCQECVKGRRDNPPHRSLPAKVRDVPEVGMDYCFLRRPENPEQITILVQKDRDSRALRTQVVESKGVIIEEAVVAELRGIHEFGHQGKVILKADGENAMKPLKQEVLRRMDQGVLHRNWSLMNMSLMVPLRTA